jgi:hypothetical protein
MARMRVESGRPRVSAGGFGEQEKMMKMEEASKRQ